MEGKLEFRCRTKFEDLSDYENVFAVIERIKSRCKDCEIHETFDGCQADAFENMSLPTNENESYLKDKNLLYFDSADSLMKLNKAICGNYGWEEIADIIGETSGNGRNNTTWTLYTYKLKPQYAQMLIDSLDELKEKITKNYEMLLEEEKEKGQELEEIKTSIVSIETREKTIKDEGGKTKKYIHTIVMPDGERLTFSERNVFDFGIVINPEYRVTPSSEIGGLCLDIDGLPQWSEFKKEEGWVAIRPLTENEINAINYLEHFGGFSEDRVRM